MEQVSYRVGDIRRIIKESADEFKAKIGDGVTADNKRNNDKSYRDAEKAAKDFDGGLKDPKKGTLPDKADGNRTTLDYTPRTDAGKDFKDKVDAQAKGYTSKMEMNNGIAKAGAEFDNDGAIKKNFAKASDELNDEKTKLANSGLQGREIKTDKPNTMYESSKPICKRLHFKYTTFMNEAQMLNRIPEEYKKDGAKLYMIDGSDNEYIVECVKSEGSGFIETNIVGYKNDRLMKEQEEDIQRLFNYDKAKSESYVAPRERINENDVFQEILNITRGKSIIK